ncbi:MAG: hypothetical protein K9N62_08240 [Verrucomicrobia bacterium]|nr:hypothetical protein [Verrucomicrobiota bacterium]
MILTARWLLMGWILGFAVLQTGAAPADPVRDFVLKYCSDCHESEVSKGGLNLVEEDGETLLDRTMILYGSNLGNANTHVTTNLPPNSQTDESGK